MSSPKNSSSDKNSTKEPQKPTPETKEEIKGTGIPDIDFKKLMGCGG